MNPIMPVLEGEFGECVEFLAARERRCVSLMSNLVIDGKTRFPNRGVRAFARVIDRKKPGVEGIFLVTGAGILFTCLDETARRDDIKPYIARFLSRVPIRCLIGTQADARFIESIMPNEPQRSVDYRLLSYDPTALSSPAGDALSRGQWEFVPCGPNDTEKLLTLQEAYEREEVVPPDEPINRESTRLRLRATLEKQRVFMVVAGEKPIAKAGTNAIGLGWSQLGGVYTLPEKRGLGIATALVRRVADEETARGLGVALFVKLSNAAAQKAYENAGFREEGFFRISYW